MDPRSANPIDWDRRRAEELLFVIAAELRRIPMNERTKELHLRALRAKRDVTQWSRDPPAEPARLRSIEELVRIHAEAERERTRAVQTSRLARRGP
jgi:hypothetical protein